MKRFRSLRFEKLEKLLQNKYYSLFKKGANFNIKNL
jgi:hypothetical protein